MFNAYAARIAKVTPCASTRIRIHEQLVRIYMYIAKSSRIAMGRTAEDAELR